MFLQIKTHSHNIYIFIVLIDKIISKFYHDWLNTLYFLLKWSLKITANTTVIKIICIFYIQRVLDYCISAEFVSWWVISHRIHNQSVLHVKTHTNNISFSLFWLIFQFFIITMMVGSHNILWYNELKETCPKQWWVQ